MGRRAGSFEGTPPATFQWVPLRLPAGGGAYFRLLPYGVVRAAVRQGEQRAGSGTFYVHPWEGDPRQPRVAVPGLTRARHYGGLRRTLPRLERLLTEFRFAPIRETIAVLGRARARTSRPERILCRNSA